MGPGSEEELLRELGTLTAEKRCSTGFLEGVRRLLLWLKLRPPLSSDPEVGHLLLRVEELSSRLRDSYSGCRSDTPLRGEWRRVSDYEFQRLKEELSALGELLEGRAGRHPTLDLKALADEMREEGAIRETTWALLLSSPCGPREMEREEVREVLLRVLRLFSEFRARGGIGEVRKEEGALRAGGAR